MGLAANAFPVYGTLPAPHLSIEKPLPMIAAPLFIVRIFPIIERVTRRELTFCMKSPMKARPSRSLVLSLALTFLWLFFVVAGLLQVERYEDRPGKTASAPVRWPENTRVRDAHNGVTLLMVIHPQCPCSRASLAELSQLMARSQGRVSATVLFVQYAGVSKRWVQSSTWRQAAAIPGVRVDSDPNGALAERFSAQTSGQTYLYDRQGRLLFSGGLTGARGHEGDNAGLDAALALARSQVPQRSRTPVFGCPLFPQTPPAEKAQDDRT